MQHHVSFEVSSPYYTLNTITSATNDIWIVCHGFGQLAEHFIRRFDILDPQKNFVLAPQGLSRFYMNDYKHVGASWMTRVDKETELTNQKSYIRSVVKEALQGHSLSDFSVHLLGFSQGVSTVCRMASYMSINFCQLVLWAGGFPDELTKADFQHLDQSSKFNVVLGRHDDLIPLDEDFQHAVSRAENTLGLKADITLFDGGHEVSRDVLAQLVI